ncbi:MAG: DUF4837 family protein [Bacteroidia bacterium]|nr:MAG: DUF4837 family protein [Bacteroidia bacterium]
MARINVLKNFKACLLLRTGFFVFASFLLVLTSCDTVNQQGGAAGRIMPNISGGAAEVLVVMDQLNWENSTGQLLQDILKEEIPGLPQSEPLFDVLQVSAASFDGIYQFHRSIVLTKIESGLEPRIRFREIVWAKPQIMVQLEAPTGKELMELISENEDRIQQFLVQYDRNRLIKNYRDSKDPAIQKEIALHHQVRLAIPRGYNMDFSKEEYTSVSIEAPDLSQVIQVYDYPAEGPQDLNTANIIEKRNTFTKMYVQGPRENSYMTISKLYEPIAYDLEVNNVKIIELRGLWDLENGFMGGPFISHSVYDAQRNRIVTVDGYVYHPNQKKRIKMKQMEAIIYSLEII